MRAFDIFFHRFFAAAFARRTVFVRYLHTSEVIFRAYCYNAPHNWNNYVAYYLILVKSQTHTHIPINFPIYPRQIHVFVANNDDNYNHYYFLYLTTSHAFCLLLLFILSSIWIFFYFYVRLLLFY